MKVQTLNPILKYPPDNRIRYLDIDIEDIVVGGTTIHTFNVPLNIATAVSSLNIIYGSGIGVVVNKSLDDYPDVSYVLNEDGTSDLKCILTPEDTLLFKDWDREATVQLKFVMLDNGTVEYSDIYYLRVLKTLDNK